MIAEKLNIQKRLDSMDPKKVKNAVISIIIVLILAFIIRSLMPSAYSGEDAMNKIIKAETAAEAEVVAVWSSDGSYIAGYTSESGCGYAVFSKNTAGEYELDLLKYPSELEERSEGIYFAEDDKRIIVVSENKSLSKIGVLRTVDGFFNSEEMKTGVHGNPSITVITLNENEKLEKINFYNSKGMPIR